MTINLENLKFEALSDQNSEANADRHPYTYDVSIDDNGIQINIIVDGTLFKKILIDGRENKLELSILPHHGQKCEYRNDLVPPRQIEDRLKRL